MGYTPCQPAPSPGRLPVDAPKRYAGASWRAPPPRRLGSSLRVLGPQPARAVCFMVPTFYFISRVCLPSVARPWGLNREPRWPPLSARSRGDRQARCLRASPPAPRTSPAPPGTATARAVVWPGDVCAGPGARPHFWTRRKQRGPVRVGFSEEPSLSRCERRERVSALES